MNNVLVEAIQWLLSLLTGGFATSVAIIAIAVLGLSAMTGRLHLVRAGQVAFGCFTLFSANVIAQGLLSAVSAEPLPSPPQEVINRYTPSVPPPPSPDPYAGAALIRRDTENVLEK